MAKQRTLKKSFSLEGKGLHTGANTCITFKPAPKNHGYKIRRTDVEGQPVIDAVAENVSNTQRSTTLSGNGVSVSTVEHALAALYASEIDNCLIEVNGPEFPILDGSSILYIGHIKKAGIINQDAERNYISFDHQKVQVYDEETGSSLLLLPGDTFTVQVKVDFKSEILNQQYASLTNLRHFATEIAPARTFTFVREIRQLLERGLIKGGDIDNAIVIYDSVIPQKEYDRLADMAGLTHKNAGNLGYIMNKPLQFPNEPARHKLLDIIGDLALAGGFIKGKIVANCPGHKTNTAFAYAIRKKYLSRMERKETRRYLLPESSPVFQQA